MRGRGRGGWEWSEQLTGRRLFGDHRQGLASHGRRYLYLVVGMAEVLNILLVEDSNLFFGFRHLCSVLCWSPRRTVDYGGQAIVWGMGISGAYLFPPHISPTHRRTPYNHHICPPSAVTQKIESGFTCGVLLKPNRCGLACTSCFRIICSYV